MLYLQICFEIVHITIYVVHTKDPYNYDYCCNILQEFVKKCILFYNLPMHTCTFSETNAQMMMP